jgi:hypothetical protein
MIAQSGKLLNLKLMCPEKDFVIVLQQSKAICDFIDSIIAVTYDFAETAVKKP